MLLAHNSLRWSPVVSLLGLSPEPTYMDSKGCWGIEAFMKLRYSLRPQVESRREVGKILLLGRRIDLNSEQ
jgi:hypothetical protein